MKKKTKLIIEIFAAVTLIVLLSVGIFSSSAVSEDPADSYEYQEAEYEEYGIDLWFDYSFRKTFTSDTESTGRDTFSIYMAKNEVESCQFVLYSDDDFTGLTAEVTDFTDGNGNSVNAEIYYEYYITTDHLNKNTVWGATESNNFIREGETPDPIAPLDNVGAFNLIGGKSQAFLIRAKTLDDSVAGWYSARLNVKDNDGYVIKTATVYLHVWDFALSEKTALETAFLIGSENRWGGNYKVFYDYMLDHRMCGFDIPNGIY